MGLKTEIETQKEGREGETKWGKSERHPETERPDRLNETPRDAHRGGFQQRETERQTDRQTKMA